MSRWHVVTTSQLNRTNAVYTHKSLVAPIKRASVNSLLRQAFSSMTPANLASGMWIFLEFAWTVSEGCVVSPLYGDPWTSRVQTRPQTVRALLPTRTEFTPVGFGAVGFGLTAETNRNDKYLR